MTDNDTEHPREDDRNDELEESPVLRPGSGRGPRGRGSGEIEAAPGDERS